MNKEIAFAKEIREKNDYIKIGYGIYFVFYIGWMFCINLFLDYHLKDFGDRIGGILLLLGMVFFMVLFSGQYLNSFFAVAGKNAERTQNIFTVTVWLPFSNQAYAEFVRQQMVFWQWCIFGVTAGVNGLGMLIFTYHDFFPVYLWETPVTAFYIFSRLLAIVLVSLIMAMIPRWVLAGKTGYIGKKRLGKVREVNYLDAGKKAKTKRTEKRIKRLFLVVEVLIIIFLSTIYLLLTDALHSLDDNQVVYLNIKLYYVYLFLCGILATDINQVYTNFCNWVSEELSPQEKSRQKRSILIKIGIVILLFMVPQCWYDTYYEDRLEVTCMFYEKTYEWQEVASYEVYHPFFGNNIQISLHMEDGTNYKVLNGHAIISEAYYEVYASDYNYVEALVEKLDTLGVEGKLQDAEKIEKKIYEDEVNEQKAWTHIKEIMEVY